MRITETKVYLFNELSKATKEKARDWCREGALEHAWWNCVYEDAEQVGLKIEEFDLGRSSCMKAKFLASAEETAHKIETEHGESCETFKDAKIYLEKRDEVINTAPKDINSEFEDTYALDKRLDELDAEFLKILEEDYRIMLEKEMEYLLSDERVNEMIEANEYEFTEEGKRIC